MDKEQALNLVRQYKQIISGMFDTSKVYMFGSYSKGYANPESVAAEEVFGRGAKAYDYDALPLKSGQVYCFDLAGPVGSAALRAPTMIGWKAALKGRAAHAGFAPETGINVFMLIMLSHLSSGL